MMTSLYRRLASFPLVTVLAGGFVAWMIWQFLKEYTHVVG